MDWRELTRFTESGRLAFNREAALWSTLQLADKKAASLQSPAGAGRYSVALDDHISTLQDHTTFHAAVLIHSYALAEFSACVQLGIDSRSAGGVESWGAALLQSNGQNWGKVLDGEAGAVEVAVCRNVFAHGSREIDAQAASRLGAAGSSLWALGDQVGLNYDDLRLFRDRLRSLLRVGGL